MINDMVEGYFDGRSSDRKNISEYLDNRSAAYKHGWLNGRDDRLGSPREKASVLRNRADIILNNMGDN